MQPASVNALADRYRAVGTAAVFSALQGLHGTPRLFALEIRPIRPEQVIVGPAFTLKAVRDPRTHHTPEVEIPKLADYAMFRAMTAGCVIVADPGERAHTGFWGDLMSAAAYSSGARGIVIDGCARDTRELIKMSGFPVFCRRTTMSSTERRVLTVDFQVPITVDGSLEHQIEIVPGDWIYGDVDGVVAIPADRVEEVITAAEKAEVREALIRDDFLAGEKVWDVYPKHGRL